MAGHLVGRGVRRMNVLLTRQPKPTAAVPCDGCRACCFHELIVLHPEDGDDAATYDTMIVPHPMRGGSVAALKQRSDGACVYLGAEGCTIHDRRPAICRTFDCRRMAALVRSRVDRAQFKRLAAKNPVLQAGRARSVKLQLDAK